MATRPKTIDEASAAETVKEMLDAGSDCETALQYLRDSNFDQIDSIKVMRFAMKVSANEAKKLVHYSRTWEDRRGAAEAIHEAAFEVIEKMQREDSE